MTMFKFTKEKDRWFIDLPTWKGAKDELEMVMGADTMLDILAQGDDIVHAYISMKAFDAPIILTFEKEEHEGATYTLVSEYHTFPVWLCHVTKFVFGCFPKKIYIK